MATRISDFEIIDHGIEHSQYFQGCGVAFTSYANVTTGIGANFAEAYEDCCEQMASADVWGPEGLESWDWAEFDKRVLKHIGRRSLPKRPAVTSRHSDEHYYHVSIRYNVETPAQPLSQDSYAERAARWDGETYTSEHDSNGNA